MRIAITGPEGLMGRELCKLIDCIPLPHSRMDITNEKQVREVLGKVKPDLVVHLAADVRTDGVDKQHTYDVNVIGTRNVAKNTPRMLYISTEYVFDGTKGNYTESDYPNPLQYYGLTKLSGEYEARNCPHSVVARLLFKPRPYKHSVVPVGMMTSGGYVDDMAKELVKAINIFDSLPPVINIGIKRRGLKDLALETRQVEDIDINTLPIRIPLDASLDLTLWRKLCPKD